MKLSTIIDDTLHTVHGAFVSRLSNAAGLVRLANVSDFVDDLLRGFHVLKLGWPCESGAVHPCHNLLERETDRQDPPELQDSLGRLAEDTSVFMAGQVDLSIYQHFVCDAICEDSAECGGEPQGRFLR